MVLNPIPMITIWNQLIRSCLYYCSPLWSPKPSNFYKIDLLGETQRSFTRQIDGMDGLDYAERLKKKKKPMYSIQRKHERFKILYMYKIKEGLVPNISSKYGLTFNVHVRHGCRCDIPNFPTREKARKARGCSFSWSACNLWNSLPKCVRNITREDIKFFKNKLDKVLAFYPEVPRYSRSGHSYDRNGRKSNYLCNHYRNVKIRHEIYNIIDV